MVKLIHADGFFKAEEVQNLLGVAYNLYDNFVEKEYGYELQDFNMVFPGLDPIFSRIVGEEVVVDEERSGIFRRPFNFVHFESFEGPNDWCFIVALEKTTFNLYHHLENGPASKVNAWSALDGYRFNYRNLLEWDVYTNIVLEPNQGVLFKPWLFHSLDGGNVQYYRLVNKIKDNTP